jgi:hypothetical protein
VTENWSGRDSNSALNQTVQGLGHGVHTQLQNGTRRSDASSGGERDNASIPVRCSPNRKQRQKQQVADSHMVTIRVCTTCQPLNNSVYASQAGLHNISYFHDPLNPGTASILGTGVQLRATNYVICFTLIIGPDAISGIAIVAMVTSGIKQKVSRSQLALK